jgi:hypothetical protein
MLFSYTSVEPSFIIASLRNMNPEKEERLSGNDPGGLLYAD